MKKGLIGLLILLFAATAWGQSPPAQSPNWTKVRSGVKVDSTDQTTNLRAALATAAKRTGYLRLDSGVVLLTDSIVVPEGVTLEGNNTKLQFEFSDSTKALIMSDNSTVRNMTIDVDSSTAITGSGAHGACIVVGSDGTGTGVKNVTIENVVLTTERLDAITILGGSENVTVNNARVLNSTTIEVGILCEWGNVFYDTTLAGDTGHVQNPHNITLSNITIDTLSASGNIGIALSGAYNVNVQNVQMRKVSEGLRIAMGDPGFRYSDTDYLDTSWFSPYGINIENVVIHRSEGVGAWIYGKSQVMGGGANNHIPDSEAVWDMPVSVENCTFSGDSTTSVGLLLTNANNVTVSNCLFRNYYFGIYPQINTHRVKIRDCEVTHNLRTGIWVGNDSLPPTDILIENCYSHGNGLLPEDAITSGIYVGRSNRVIVNNNRMGDTTAEGTLYGLRIDNTAVGVSANNNYVFDVYDSTAALPYSIPSNDSSVIMFLGNDADDGMDHVTSQIRFTRNSSIAIEGSEGSTDGDTLSKDYWGGTLRLLSSAASSNSGGAVWFGSNKADTTKYYAAIRGLLYDWDDSSKGNLGFFTQPTGTDIPLSLAMLLSWQGRLGLNTSTPSERLHVAGKIKADSNVTIGAYTLPMVDGTASQGLVTDGSGAVSWATVGGSGETNTLADTGTFNGTEGFGLVTTKVGSELRTRGLIEGTGITMALSGDTGLTITSSGDVDTSAAAIAAALNAHDDLYDEFSEIGGSVSDAQVPNDITITEADPVWTSDSADYAMKDILDDSARAAAGDSIALCLRLATGGIMNGDINMADNQKIYGYSSRDGGTEHSIFFTPDSIYGETDGLAGGTGQWVWASDELRAAAGGSFTIGTGVAWAGDAIADGYFSAYSDLGTESKIGTGAEQVAAGNHDHSGTYVETESDPVYIDDPAFGITATDTVNWNEAKDSSQHDYLRSDETADDVDTAGTDIAAALADRANIHDTLPKSFVITNIAATHDFPFWKVMHGITIVGASGVCVGGTNVIGCLMEYDGDAANPVACNSADWTFTTGEETITAVSNGSIDADDWLGWKTTSVSGEVATFSLTIRYTVD